MERGSQKKQVEMNRRPKFLTIEGIQKRKNPDKNYVSVSVFSFQLNLLFLIFNLSRIINESARIPKYAGRDSMISNNSHDLVVISGQMSNCVR